MSDWVLFWREFHIDSKYPHIFEVISLCQWLIVYQIYVYQMKHFTYEFELLPLLDCKSNWTNRINKEFLTNVYSLCIHIRNRKKGRTPRLSEWTETKQNDLPSGLYSYVTEVSVTSSSSHSWPPQTSVWVDCTEMRSSSATDSSSK